MHYSPLRYPGGKNKLSVFIAKICTDNNIKKHYVEPYAGGASVALFLLFEGYVKNITINDKDRSIYAVWYSILHHTEQLCTLIQDCKIDIGTWREQRIVQQKKDHIDLLSLGFSTLYLNRTNRSGIINGGVIGGVEQLGNYKMNCRFNKSDLIQRIRLIASKKDKIRVCNKDALSLIEQIKSKPTRNNTIIYFDPPYFDKGSSLYMNHYKKDDHVAVSNMIKNIDGLLWIVSYDNVSEIKNLYLGYCKKEYSFKHTAYESRQGQEILFFSPLLKLPEIEDWNPLCFKLNKARNKIIYKPTKIEQLSTLCQMSDLAK